MSGVQCLGNVKSRACGGMVCRLSAVSEMCVSGWAGELMRGARAQVKGCEGGQGERVEGGTKLKRTEQESFVWRYIRAPRVHLQSFALSPVCGSLPTQNNRTRAFVIASV